MSHLFSEPVQNIIQTTQKNCDISDAKYSGHYGLCVYLLKMRELYRWETHQALDAILDQNLIGDWLTEKETYWKTLEKVEFADFVLSNQKIDCFDVAPINQILAPFNLVYSAGLSHAGRAQFFIGELKKTEQYQDFTIYIADQEWARGLTALPAMNRENTVFIRQDAILRMLHDKLDDWQWKKPDNALGRAFSEYDFEQDLVASLTQMTADQLLLIKAHEIGEYQAGQLLGEGWNARLLALPHSRAELIMRAVRDHVADLLSTIPTLIKENKSHSLHFLMGNMGGMRKLIFPAIFEQYQQWIKHGKDESWLDFTHQQSVFWRDLALQIVQLKNDKHLQHHIESLVSL